MADRPLMFRTQPSVTSTASPEAVYDVIADLRNHLVWSGERAEDEGFKMLTLDAPEGPATVGTSFTSSGIRRQGHVPRPVGGHAVVAAAHVRHRDRRALGAQERQDVGGALLPSLRRRAGGDGSRIVYTETVERVNYVPYWLKPGIRTIFRPWVNRADRKQLRNLARLAEERSRRSAG